MESSHDTLCDLLACSHICEREIAKTPANRNNLVPLPLADGSTASVKCMDVPDIVAAYCVAHRDHRVSIAGKLRAVRLATDLSTINTIN